MSGWKTPEGRDFAQKIKDAFFKQAKGKEAMADERRRKLDEAEAERKRKNKEAEEYGE